METFVTWLRFLLEIVFWLGLVTGFLVISVLQRRRLRRQGGPNHTQEEIDLIEKRAKNWLTAILVEIILFACLYMVYWNRPQSTLLSTDLAAQQLNEKRRISKDRAHEITLLTSQTKVNLLQSFVDAFNKKYDGEYFVRLSDALESREASQSILNHTNSPVIFSPSDSIWLVMLAYQLPQTSVANKQNNQLPPPPRRGQSNLLPQPQTLPSPFVKLTPSNLSVDGTTCRRFFETPMSVITRIPVTPAVSRIFSRQDPWTHLATPFPSNPSALNFVMAKPIAANSGARIIFMILKEYQRTNMPNQPDLRQVAISTDFLRFLTRVKQSYRPYSGERQNGRVIYFEDRSRLLFDKYTTQMPPDRDCLITYESFVAEQTEETSFENRKFAKIDLLQPEVNDNPFVILNNASPHQIQGAKKFLDFMERAVLDETPGVGVDPVIKSLRGDLAKYHFRRSNFQYGRSQGDLSLRIKEYYAQNYAIAQWDSIP